MYILKLCRNKDKPNCLYVEIYFKWIVSTNLKVKCCMDESSIIIILNSSFKVFLHISLVIHWQLKDVIIGGKEEKNQYVIKWSDLIYHYWLLKDTM